MVDETDFETGDHQEAYDEAINSSTTRSKTTPAQSAQTAANARQKKKPIVCPICQKCFQWSSEYQTHQLTHAGM